MKFRFVVISIFLLILSFKVYAESVNCSDLKIAGVWIEGPRDDNFKFQNMMVIHFEKMCEGKEWVHVKKTNPLLNSFLSLALSAEARNSPVSIVINKSEHTTLSYQLAAIGIEK